ncbi:ferritin-like domain-containing protein [Tunturibacter psychrotolerans]|uniref:Ferritin-like domain-containing protein n=1 Tax=Tunturiibacter psychrotolerans TaxID=3069686 RepID=A0AAU7ZNT8_9BACT
MEKKLNDLIDKALSRRQFLAGAGTTAAAALVVGCNSSTTTPSPTPTPTPTPLDLPDNDILNFALNLEYLEAEFYLYAATGSGLSTADALAGAGTTIVPANLVAVPWTSPVQAQFAAELAQTELDHVRYLQGAITANTGTPVARPAIDLTFFASLATAAGITTPFNPFADPNSFLVGAFTFEDVGVTAYAGGGPALISNILLSGVAGLQAAEAYHAAAVRTQIAGGAANTGDATFLNWANDISALRATLGGGNETALSLSSIVAADPTNALGFARTTDQVLHIVYGKAGGAGLSKGGFFPNGLNGTITTTAS